MATEDKTSAQITSMDATNPTKRAHARLSGSPLISVIGTVVTLLAATDVGSTYRMVRLPQNAMVHAVYLSCDTLGDTGDGDVGISKPSAIGGAVVDADHFASATDMNAGPVYRRDLTHESGAYGIEDVEKPLWSALGETEFSSPNGYDVVITITEISTALADLTVEVLYSL